MKRITKNLFLNTLYVDGKRIEEYLFASIKESFFKLEKVEVLFLDAYFVPAFSFTSLQYLSVKEKNGELYLINELDHSLYNEFVESNNIYGITDFKRNHPLHHPLHIIIYNKHGNVLHIENDFVYDDMMSELVKL